MQRATEFEEKSTGISHLYSTKQRFTMNYWARGSFMVIVGRSSHVSPAVSTKHISTTLYIMQRITPVPSAQGINTTQRTITQSPRHWIYTGTKPVNNFGPDSRWSLYRYWDVIIHEVYERSTCITWKIEIIWIWKRRVLGIIQGSAKEKEPSW